MVRSALGAGFVADGFFDDLCTRVSRQSEESISQVRAVRSASASVVVHRRIQLRVDLNNGHTSGGPSFLSSLIHPLRNQLLLFEADDSGIRAMGVRKSTNYSGLLPTARRAGSAFWPHCSIAAFHCIFYANVHDDYSGDGSHQNKRKLREDVACALLCGDQPLCLSTLTRDTVVLTTLH